jgi:thioredoxin reductase
MMAETPFPEDKCTVAIVGGGTSGLALAAELMRLSAGKVVVLERESEAGGIPRHCGHYPFGISEYKWLLKGPDYARRNWEIAVKLGADIRANTTVTALRPGGILEVASSERRYHLAADRVVLCTGVRESSRAQRFISGDRLTGIITTGALQSLVFLKNIKPFKRPVIMGSELISFSAIRTCAHMGINPVAMIEEEDRILARRFLQPYLAFKNVRLHTGITDPRIIGSESVEGLEFNKANGKQHKIETDGIIVSGRFRPESALLHTSHLEVDPNTGGAVVDQFGRCTDPSYFCAGNILRPAETSGFCWKEGIDTARRVAADLLQGSIREMQTVPVLIRDPVIRFAVPQRLCLTDEPGGMDSFYLGLNERVNAEIILHYNDRERWKGKLNSKPIRRIQVPIPKIAMNDLPAEIGISVSR